MNKRTFLKNLFTGTAGVVVASTVQPNPVSADSPVVIPSPPVTVPYPEGMVSWPCLKCKAEQVTPLMVWPSVKMNLSCPSCGYRQPYLWHLKKFDPRPTEYGGAPGHPLQRLADTGSKQSRYGDFTPKPEPPLTDKELFSATPRGRAMQFYRERRARKMERKGRW